MPKKERLKDQVTLISPDSEWLVIWEVMEHEEENFAIVDAEDLERLCQSRWIMVYRTIMGRDAPYKDVSLKYAVMNTKVSKGWRLRQINACSDDSCKSLRQINAESNDFRKSNLEKIPWGKQKIPKTSWKRHPEYIKYMKKVEAGLIDPRKAMPDKLFERIFGK